MAAKVHYYSGGAGDVINQIYARSCYADLAQMSPGSRVDIVIASNNPFVHELFSFHPNNAILTIYFAGNHFVTACEQYKDQKERANYILEHCGLSSDNLDMGTGKPERPIAFPQVCPIVPRSNRRNILICPDAATPGKSAPRGLRSLLPSVIRKCPEYDFYILKRDYVKVYSDGRASQWLGSPEVPLVQIPRIVRIAPTFPDTLNFIRDHCELLITPHSCLGQFARYENIRTVVMYPDQHPDFLPEHFSRESARDFVGPRFTLMPFSSLSERALTEAIKMPVL
jgi:hypothetical protein